MHDSLSILKNSKGLLGFVCFRNSRALLVILMNSNVTCCVPRARDAEMSIEQNAQDKFTETCDPFCAPKSRDALPVSAFQSYDAVSSIKHVSYCCTNLISLGSVDRQ